MKKLKLILQSKIFFPLLLFCAIVYTIFSFSKNPSCYNIKNHNFTGTILSITMNGNQMTLEMKAKEKLLISYTIPDLKILKKMKQLKLGDVITVTGNLELPSRNRNFHLFHYQNYLKGKQIFWILKADHIALQKKASGLYVFKNKILSRIENMSNQAYLKAFILGNTKELDWKNLYQELGISHLFAVSGMHIVFLTVFLFQILKKKNIISFLLVTGLLGIYIWLLQDSASANRAFLLFIFSFFNKYYQIKLKPVKLLLLTLSVLLFKNPFVVLQVGFQFSFIICFYLMIQKKKTSDSYFKTLFFTSFLASFASFPLSSFHFHQFHFGSVLINLFAVPFVSFLLFPLSFLTFFFPFLNPVFTIFIQLFHHLLSVFEILSFLKITFASISIYFVAFYYIVLFLSFSISKKWMIVFFLFLIFHFIYPHIDHHYYLDMIDIGEGDSILIRFPHLSKTILIDTGGTISYQVEEWKQRKISSQIDTILLPYFKSLGIKKIDTLILSHGDQDHMGNARELINKFPIKKVIMNSGKDTKLEKQVLQALEKKHIKYQKVSRANIHIGNQTFQFLNSKDENSENDDSLIIYTKLADSHILFMGDAEEKSEMELLREYNLPKVDILKVGHHGSKTSTKPEFLNIIEPKISLISAGENNRFSHPHKEVLAALMSVKSNTYITKQHGSIQIELGTKKIKTCLP